METHNQIPLAESAIRYLNAGLSIIPTGQNKRPTVGAWKQYQRLRASLADAEFWFSDNRNLIALIGGKISGNLNMIDFDNKAEVFDAWCELVESQLSGLLGKLVIETTQSGGKHVFYRCTSIVIEGSKKLAERAYDIPVGQKDFVLNGKTYQARQSNGKNIAIVGLIETKGEGGYCLCAPSNGYALLYGDIAALPNLTEDEHKALISSAEALNEHHEECIFEVPNKEEKIQTATAEKPGADFNRRGDVRPILEKAGWTAFQKRGKYEYWCRPGKRKAISASLIEDSTFRIFSSNAAPFEAGKSYSKFAVLTALEHKGDFAAAARTLGAQGYGKQRPAPVAKVHRELEKPKAEPEIARSQKFKNLVEDTISGKRYACKWPWHYMTTMTRALQPGTVTILCAPKGSSKSFMLLQAMAFWMESGYNPSSLMMEDDAMLHQTRALAQHLENGELTDPEWMKSNPDQARYISEQYADFNDSFGQCIHEARGGFTTDQILAWMKVVAPRSRIIAIDPILAKTPSQRPWEDDHKFMREATAIVTAYGSSLMLVTHPPKTVASALKTTAWGDDVAGGMAYQNFSQTIVYLEYLAAPEEVTIRNQMGICQVQVNRKLQLRKTRLAPGQGSTIGFYFDGKTLKFYEQGIIQD